MRELLYVAEPDPEQLESMTLAGCVLHGPTRKLVRSGMLAAKVCGWATFDPAPPRPAVEVYCQSPSIRMAGLLVALRVNL